MDKPVIGNALEPHFAGVNAPIQNGQAERCTRSLHDMALFQKIHSHHWFPIAITANLWSYTICHATAIINKTPFHCLNYTYTPVCMFSKYEIG